MPVAEHSELRIWRVSLEQIEATVAEFLGPGRVKGNRSGPAFSRHVSMYLARHVSGWDYAKISRFYNGRREATVIAAIRKIEKLRQHDEEVDSLIEVLTATLYGDISPATQNAAESRSRTRSLKPSLIA